MCVRLKVRRGSQRHLEKEALAHSDRTGPPSPHHTSRDTLAIHPLNRPYQLSLGFVPAVAAPVELVQTTILWKGKPYAIQQRVTPNESRRGELALRFGRKDFLPAGRARFQVRLFDSEGGTVEAGLGTYVLPSNPLQVNLTPGNAHYLGWVARPILKSATVASRGIDWTVSNTTGGTRRFGGVDWIATDGGSGLETIHDGFSFSVGNNSTASFRTSLSSPANSPIGSRSTRVGTSRFESGYATIAASPLIDDRRAALVRLNANIIRVGPFQSGDRAGLAQAATHGSAIYQQVNLTANRVENNWMMTGDTAPWETIDAGRPTTSFSTPASTTMGSTSSLFATIRAALALRSSPATAPKVAITMAW